MDGESDMGIVGEMHFPGESGELGAEFAETRGFVLAKTHEHAADRSCPQVHPEGIIEFAMEFDAAGGSGLDFGNAQPAQLLPGSLLETWMDHGEKIVAFALYMILDAPGQRFFVDLIPWSCHYLIFQPLPRKIFSMAFLLNLALHSVHCFSMER